MIAGCYARKSNDEKDKDPDAKSVARQVARAREYAKAEGWIFDDSTSLTCLQLTFRQHRRDRRR